MPYQQPIPAPEPAPKLPPGLDHLLTARKMLAPLVAPRSNIVTPDTPQIKAADALVMLINISFHQQLFMEKLVGVEPTAAKPEADPETTESDT